MSASRYSEQAPSEGTGAGSVSGQSDGGQANLQDEGTPAENLKIRKRRAPSHVSQNACKNCKKARAKCDGDEPAPCSRCRTRGISDQCHYEVHVKTAKEEMIRRIKNLEMQNTEKDRWIESVFSALSDNELITEGKLPWKGQSYEELIEWLGQPPVQDTNRLSPTSESNLFGIVQRYENSMRISASPDAGLSPQSQWTEVTSSVRLTHHLMALYFSWIHPAHMLFSEKHFMTSFDSGSRTYCSPALVNMICAMGCFFLVDQGRDGIDARGLASKFMLEAKREITKQERNSLPFASTYAVMFLVEISTGWARKASSHLRLAAKSLQHIDRSSVDAEAVEIALWGIHSLNTTWAGFTYEMLSAPTWPLADIFKSVQSDPFNAMWHPYPEPIGNISTEIPSRAILTAGEMAKLNQIINETLRTYCGSKGKITARIVINLYRKYLQWKADLPEALGAPTLGSGGLPHALYLHVLYHVAICQLFRPLVVYKHFPERTRDLIEKIIVRAAETGLSLFQIHRSLFSCRYQTPLQAFCVLYLAEGLLLGGPVERQLALNVCLGSLRENLPAFAFSGPLQAMFCAAAVERGYTLPDNIEEYMEGRMHYSLEEMLNICEHITYGKSEDPDILDLFDRSLGDTFQHEWEVFIEQHGSSEDVTMVDEIAENTTSARGIEDGEGSPSRHSEGSRSMHIQSLVNP